MKNICKIAVSIFAVLALILCNSALGNACTSLDLKELKASDIESAKYTPTSLTIVLKNKATIYIVSSNEAKVKKISEYQTEIIRSSLKDQVTVSLPNIGHFIRLVCPKTKIFLDSGYAKLFQKN